MVHRNTESTEDKPCRECPDHRPVPTALKAPITRRRFVLGGIATGVGLFLTQFLPPLPGVGRILGAPGVALAFCNNECYDPHCSWFLGGGCTCFPGICNCTGGAPDFYSIYEYYYWLTDCSCGAYCDVQMYVVCDAAFC